MKNKLVIILILFTIGILSCINSSLKYKKEVKPFVKEFENLYNVKVKTDISFKNLPETAGVCVNYLIGSEIFIDSEVWDNLSFEERDWLVFHELGHCYFDLDHYDEMNIDNCPKSIMHRHSISYANTCYKKWDEILKKNIKEFDKK